MATHEQMLAQNAQYWDEVAKIHGLSQLCGVSGVLDGESTLNPIDVETLSSLDGRSVLHMHCHIGLDSLSLARLGARVVGADLSPRAISIARSLCASSGLNVRFVCAEAAQLSQILAEKFDLVWATEGVIAWMPDVDEWMATAAGVLNKGGVLYLRDFHPIAEVLDHHSPRPEVIRPYASEVNAITSEDEPGIYSDRSVTLKTDCHYEWQHTLGDVVTAATRAGFRINELREFTHCTYRSHEFLRKVGTKRWEWPFERGSLPMMFSLLCERE